MGRKPHRSSRRREAWFSEPVKAQIRRSPEVHPRSSMVFTSAVATPLRRNSWRTKTASSAEASWSATRKQWPTAAPAGDHAPRFISWLRATSIHSRRGSLPRGGRPRAAPRGSNRSYISMRRSRCCRPTARIRMSRSILLGTQNPVRRRRTLLRRAIARVGPFYLYTRDWNVWEHGEGGILHSLTASEG